jgi:nickel/cobalt transporter (NicO) family protein
MIFHESALTLEFAFFIGFIHALEPGHGKTALLAYMLQTEKRNYLHPLLIGLSSAISHSISLFTIAFLVHLTSHILTGDHHHVEQVSIVLQYVSSILILCVGVYMLIQSLRGSDAVCRCSQRKHMPAEDIEHECHTHENSQHTRHEHHSCNCRSADHAHHATSNVSAKSDFKLTMLLGMGVGLLPCPSAMAAYFAGLSSGKITAAYLTITLFCAGMATALFSIGMLLQYSSHALHHRFSNSTFSKGWSLIRALLILGIGLFYSIHLVL